MTLCLLAGYWMWVGIDGFVLLAQDANGPSNPLMKLVAVLPGAWMNNFVDRPFLDLPAAGCSSAHCSRCGDFSWSPRVGDF
ncbi:hypothetical protein ACNKHM_01415 [Shigella sonnei]